MTSYGNPSYHSFKPVTSQLVIVRSFVGSLGIRVIIVIVELGGSIIVEVDVSMKYPNWRHFDGSVSIHFRDDAIRYKQRIVGAVPNILKLRTCLVPIVSDYR